MCSICICDDRYRIPLLWKPVSRAGCFSLTSSESSINKGAQGLAHDLLQQWVEGSRVWCTRVWLTATNLIPLPLWGLCLHACSLDKPTLTFWGDGHGCGSWGWSLSSCQKEHPLLRKEKWLWAANTLISVIRFQVTVVLMDWVKQVYFLKISKKNKNLSIIRDTLSSYNANTKKAPRALSVLSEDQS